MIRSIFWLAWLGILGIGGAQASEITLTFRDEAGKEQTLKTLAIPPGEQKLEILLPASEGEAPRKVEILISAPQTPDPKEAAPTLLSKVELEQIIEASETSLEESPRPFRAYHDLKSLFGNFLGIIPYRANYILPLSHSLRERPSDGKESEAKFQLSFKAPLAREIFDSKLDLYLAYTQRSFWQVYDTEDSSPFRETNYEPEIFFSYPLALPLAGGVLEQVNFGFNHESNGQVVEKSRSWNRLFVEGIYNHHNLIIALKAWHRLAEKKKSFPLDPRGDDNPDILSYLGYGELKVGYLWDKHLFSATWRNNLRFDSRNRGSILLDYSYPLQENLHLYLQYFSGYGESLLDYRRSVDRVGVGFLFTR